MYVRGKYRDVILPMTVIRRLDAMLEETKPAVLEMKKQLDAARIDNQWAALCNAAQQAFCNASPFLLKDLTSRGAKQTLEADFKAYLNGFSPNVQEILEKFKFRDQMCLGNLGSALWSLIFRTCGGVVRRCGRHRAVGWVIWS
ncbi:MAG: type I restriction-modification system subunit M N-terminal domain-containing protein [Bifidobacteriaceae bacterium]|nr:type I restriction-modification system subunit M N-terminal domain-containing protein [Bifidobacteriaceae bacterium]